MSSQSSSSSSIVLRAAMCMVPAALAFVTGASAQPLLNTLTLVRDGQPAPGTLGTNGLTLNLTPVGMLRGFSNLATTSSSGTTAFRGILLGPGVTASNETAIFRGVPGNLTLLLRQGSPLAGLPSGVVFSTASSLRLADNGAWAAVISVTGTGVATANDEAVVVDPGTGPQVVAREQSAIAGVASPELLGTIYSDSLCMSPAGATAFLARINGGNSTNDFGIWLIQNATVQLIAREGDAAPGLPSGVLYSNFFDPQSSSGPLPIPSLRLSAAGLLYTVGLVGAGITGNNDFGLWFKPNGLPSQLVVRESSNITISGESLTVGTVASGSINDAGSILYRASFTGPTINNNNNIGLVLRAASGTLSLAARRGQLVPSFGPDANINDVVSAPPLQPKLAQNDSVAFVATVRGTGLGSFGRPTIFFRTPNGQTLPIIQTQQVAPEAPDSTITSIDSFSLGDGQQVIFSVTLAGPTVNLENDNAVYSWTPSRGPRMVARENARVSVNPGESADIRNSAISFNQDTSSQSGGTNSIADDGRFVYRATFTNGTARILVVEATQYPCGLADFGGPGASPVYDGQLDNNDFIVFIQRFFEQDFLADIGSGGAEPGSDLTWDNNDFIVFIQNFFAGC